MKQIRGNLYNFGEQESITFREMNLDEVLIYCFTEFNWHEIVEIYELILSNGKILNRKQIEKLWERMNLIKIGDNSFFGKSF
jgi:hypothetical protein